MITFSFLDKSRAEEVLPVLFKILHSNMSVIAPTGNNYEEDYTCWHDSIFHVLNNPQWQIIMIFDDNTMVGYFQFSLNETTFMMEDIQFCQEYMGTGVFRQLYSYLSDIIPKKITFVEAYAHKKNEKSQGILKHLGLDIVGENKNGISYMFRGNCRKMLDMYSSENTEHMS